jgi:hypothetical protein
LTQRLPSFKHLLASTGGHTDISSPYNELHPDHISALEREHPTQDLPAKTINTSVEISPGSPHAPQASRFNPHLDLMTLGLYQRTSEEAALSVCEHVSKSANHAALSPNKPISKAAQGSCRALDGFTSLQPFSNDHQAIVPEKRRRDQDDVSTDGRFGPRKTRKRHSTFASGGDKKLISSSPEQLRTMRHQSPNECFKSPAAQKTRDSTKMLIRISEPPTQASDWDTQTVDSVPSFKPPRPDDVVRSTGTDQGFAKDPSITSQPPAIVSPETFSYGVDPYSVDPRLTERYCQHYFAHLNFQLHNILSQSILMPSIKNQAKSNDDIALLYAIMALGARASSSIRCHDKELLRDIAEKSLSQASLTIEAVQARVILSALYFLASDLEKAQKSSAVAARTACQMLVSAQPAMANLAAHVNSQQEFTNIMQTCCAATIDHCFHPYVWPVKSKPTLVSGAGLLSGDFHLDFRFLNTVFLELSDAADNDPLILGKTPLVAKISILFADVAQNLDYPAMQTRPIFSDSYESLYRNVLDQMRLWNLDAIKYLSVSEGCPTGLHLIYHFVGILLNRNWVAARRHAIGVLVLFCEISQDRKKIMEADFATSWPFASYALVAAIDIVTATGAFSDILGDQQVYSNLTFMDTVHGTMFGLQKLARTSEIAKHHLKITKQRFSILLINSKIADKSFFSTCDPLYSPFGLDRDIAYGISRVKLLHGMGLAKAVEQDSDLYELRNATTGGRTR